jgi:hypothetical protein
MQLESLATRIERLFAKQSVLRTCYPVVRLFVLVVLSLSWYVVSPWGLICFGGVFLLLCAFAPHNPFRWKPFLIASSVALVAWTVSVLRGDNAASGAMLQSVLLLCRVLLLISVAIMFLTVLDSRSMLDIFRRVPGVRALSPSLVAFLRVFPYSVWVVHRTREAWQTRGYAPHLASPVLALRVVRAVFAPRVVALLAFLSDYADVLHLRTGGDVRTRDSLQDYRATPSLAMFVVGLLLVLILLKDRGVF